MLSYSYLLVPVILFFMGVEYLYALKTQCKEIFKFESSISNLSIGIWERFCYLFSSALFYEAFVWIHEHLSLFTIPSHWLSWTILLLATDFVWYWYHRLGHEVNLFWAAHIVHHQSEEFNLTTAARITLLQAMFRTMFWCVLPVIGFSPEMVVSILLIHGGYSFFTHTQVIGKLGILERIFITPSHHRVHHASNPEYLDRNYGDIFVFWDKMFGTFQEETIPVKFGLVKPLESYSFLWGHFHFSVELWMAVKSERSIWRKIKLIFSKPENIDPQFGGISRDAFAIATSPQRQTLAGKVYVSLQMLLLLIILIWESKVYYEQPLAQSCLVGLLILISLINVCAILEQKRWVFYLEHFRIFLLVLLAMELDYLYWDGSLIIIWMALMVIILPFRHCYSNILLGKN
jgi:alkylglycerol monooxygenase